MEQCLNLDHLAVAPNLFFLFIMNGSTPTFPAKKKIQQVGDGGIPYFRREVGPQAPQNAHGLGS